MHHGRSASTTTHPPPRGTGPPSSACRQSSCVPQIHPSGLRHRTQSSMVSPVTISTRHVALGPASQPKAASGPASSREVLIIVCAGVVLASLDLFIVNIALPRIAKDFGVANL